MYATSEGLRTLLVEKVAPGGQAGTTSTIENLLGFEQGISGSELTIRAVAQARRFGTEILLARPLSAIAQDGPGYVAQLSDGTPVLTRAQLLAASNGAASRSTASTTSSVRASTTGPDAARRAASRART